MAERLNTTTAELSKAGLLPAGERVVAGIVARLAVVYGASMKPDQLELLTAVWTEELAEYPADLLMAAYHHIVRTHKDGWFPKPAQMIEHMTEMRGWRLSSFHRARRAPMVEPPKPTPEERERVLALMAQAKANLMAPPQPKSEAQRGAAGLSGDEAMAYWRERMAVG